VRLITDPLERIISDGVKTTKEEVPVDVLVLATGFDVAASFLAFKVVGKNARCLSEECRDTPAAFKGTICVSQPIDTKYYLLIIT
jgi:cation diffusion facilitator CzcD-associated flavoprotein CzcO